MCGITVVGRLTILGRLVAIAALALMASGARLILPVPAAPPAAQAQDEPVLTVTLFSSSLTFRTVPSTAVTAELVRPDGRKVSGTGISGEDGVAQVMFFAAGGPFGGGGAGAVVRPGDSIVLSRDGARPLKVTVPAFGADIDVAADRVAGTAPPGAAVQVEVTYGDNAPTTVTRTATAAADGTFGLSLAGEADLPPGAAWGAASFTTGERYRYVAQFAALSADLTISARGMRGRATPGTRVGLTVTKPGGATNMFAPVEVVNGVNYVIGAGGGPGGPGPSPAAIATGDTVAVTTTVASGVPQALGATVEPITILMDANADEVSGMGPADKDLVVTAESMENESARLSARSDGAGAYRVSTGGQADLGSGWRVRASYEAAPGVRVGAIAVAPKIRVGVDLALGQGRAKPGQSFTVTLRSGAGTVKGEQVVTAGDLGDYALFFGLGGPGEQATPQLGDQVEIAYSAADPTVLRVPRLSARTDVAGDAIAGDAQPGARLRVQVDGSPGATAVVDADGTGAYRAPLSGGFDLKRPANGAVYLMLPNGNEFYTTWAATRLTVTPGNTIGDNFVFGNGPAGRRVRAELLAPDGKTVASAETTVFTGIFFFGPGGGGGAGPQFFLTLADITGTPVDMRPGDKVRVVAGDDTTELVVPPLDAVVFVRQDTVAGHSAPNAVVRLAVAQSLTSLNLQVETRADANGNFAYNFGGQLDLHYGDFIQLATDVADHIVQTFVIAPGLFLDLDQASLLGSLAPDVAVTTTLARGGRTIAETTTETDAGGFMATQFADAGGDPVVILPGDVIEVKVSGGVAEGLTLTVPELTITWDLGADTVGGRATPGGALTMLAQDAYFREGTLGFAQAWPELTAGGTYAAEFVPGVNVRPGSRFTALYRPPAGHYVQRTRTVPILNAEHGGPNACGFADVRSDMTAGLFNAANARLAAASARARFDGYFSALWRDGADALAMTGGGQTIRAQLGTPSAEIALPGLNLQVDWQTGSLTGTGPADTAFLIGPAVPCPQQQAPGGLTIQIGGGFGFAGRTQGDGTLQGFVPPFLRDPGAGIEVSFYAPTDHRYFRHIYRALGRVFIRTARVTGQANTLQPITAILRSSGGAERGRFQTTASASGAFEGEFKTTAGAAVSSQPGDAVALQASGGEVIIPVEDISFDWSPGNTQLTGRAPAGRAIQLLLRLGDGRTFQIPRTADAGGGFRFTPDDVPPRADWSLRDVAGVRIVLTTPNGHQVIDQTASFEAGPEPTRWKIFLPAAYNRVTARAALDATRTVRAVAVKPGIEGWRWLGGIMTGGARFDGRPRDGRWPALPHRIEGYSQRMPGR